MSSDLQLLFVESDDFDTSLEQQEVQFTTPLVTQLTLNDKGRFQN